MGTEADPAASNPGSTPEEGAPMLDPTSAAEQAVTRFLQSEPTVATPTAVLARLRATIADEVELRRAREVDPAEHPTDLKQRSPLWAGDPVDDR